MKLSDYVVQFVANLGIEHIFGVCGGGNMHLIDSIGRSKDVKFIPTHHEQSAAMAAESYSRLRGLGCGLFTSGPGGTNAITGVACAFVDSIPVLFLSGQVTRATMMDGGLRQLGVQESDIVTMVQSITKYATTVEQPEHIREELEYAVYMAKSGRPGPVWIDIPLDVQNAEIDPETLDGFKPGFGPTLVPDQSDIYLVASMLAAAKRPVLIVGNGIRLAGGEDVLRLLVDRLQIPVVSSWTGADMIGDHDCHIGHCGIFGDRASNFTVQNADLILAIGTRLSLPMIGSKPEWFAPKAKIIMVDVDLAEIEKHTLDVNLGIVSDARWFLSALLDGCLSEGPNDWLARCQQWTRDYPVVLPEYANEEKINSYFFTEKLSESLPDDAIVVCATGTAFTGTYQAAKMKKGQRWISSPGHSSMGYALPGAIGAAFATGKPVICIVGDGDLQFNVAELAVIKHHNLPIVIFVLNNNGYLTMRHTQQWHFGKFVGISPESGLGFPDLDKIALAYGIEWCPVSNDEYLENLTRLMDGELPVILELKMAEDQPQIPRERPFKHPDGTSEPRPLEDMFPFLPREEFNAQILPYGYPGGDGP